MVDSLTPKTLNIMMPSYYAIFYTDGAIATAISELERAAALLKVSGNETLYFYMQEAMSALVAMRAGIGDVKTENNQELQALQQEALREQMNGKDTAEFGRVVEDDSGDSPNGSDEPRKPPIH